MVFWQALTEKAKTITGVQQWPYKAVASALEVIPRTLIQNCGGNTIRTLTALRVSPRLLVWKSTAMPHIDARHNFHGC